MRRRAFITLLGGTVAAWPFAAGAQQSALPVVGLITTGSPPSTASRDLLAFAAGLKENGYVDGQNVLVEYHWLEGQFEQLPALVNDLVRRRVALIATPSSLAGALAASRIVQFVTLASRHRIAASMANREFAEAG